MTHSLALALKAANFPQGKPKIGQFWYINGVLMYARDYSSPLFLSSNTELPGHFVYCPTAQDILEALPSSCSVSKGLSGFVVKHQYHKEEFRIHTGPTLAEALGNAYLAIYPQP